MAGKNKSGTTSSGAHSFLQALVNTLMKLVDQLGTKASPDHKPESENANLTKNNKKSSPMTSNGNRHSEKCFASSFAIIVISMTKSGRLAILPKSLQYTDIKN